MANVPSRINHGEPLSHISRHWDELVDYLRSIRIVAGSGVSVSEHPAGTVVSITPPAGSPASTASGVELRVITTAPTGGFGPAMYKRVVSIDALGVVTTESEAHATIVPRLP